EDGLDGALTGGGCESDPGEFGPEPVAAPACGDAAVDEQHGVVELERGGGSDRDALVPGSPVPDRSARAESGAGCDLHPAVEFAEFVPPAVVGVYAMVLAQGPGVGHFTDLPPRCGYPRAVGVEASQK